MAMPSITTPLVAAAIGCSRALATTWVKPISDSCRLAEITTAPELAAYLAQIGHESGGLANVVENLNYSADRIRALGMQSNPGTRWRSLVPRAAALARNPEALANAVYGGRLGNGAEASGDGWRYRGRGLIQNTGKVNYEAVRDQLRGALYPVLVPDFVKTPDALADPMWAALAAGAYWRAKGLNALALAGDFDAITRRINGGTTGAADRRARHDRAKDALKAAA